MDFDSCRILGALITLDLSLDECISTVSVESTQLNHDDFLIRMLYKDSY